MPYSTVILNNLDVTLSDLAKYSMTRNVERFLCEAELLVASMALYCNVVLLHANSDFITLTGKPALSAAM